MRICYRFKQFRADSLAIIDHANAICREYAAGGYDLTLRQLYYQFVSRDLLPNNQKSYDRLGGIINDARMAGLMDWDYIVDRTRNVRSLSHWDSPQDILDTVATQFRTDKWFEQPNRVEVWIEKDALVGVLEAACEPMDVSFFSCRGYTSVSEIWSAAQRLRGYIEQGQKAVVLHLGDHDPSGLDMTRDIDQRLWLFLATDLRDGRGDLDAMSQERAIAIANDALEVRRIALNMDQVRQYQPPPNPAKMTDARFRKYEEQYGDESWELDALPPDVLVNLIQGEIRSLQDDTLWQDAVSKEQSHKKLLKACATRWDAVTRFLAKKDAA